MAATRGAPYPALEPFARREPEPPRLLDPAAGGPPPRVVRTGRPAFWLATPTGREPYEPRRLLYALLAADLGIAPERLVVDDGPCPWCGTRHGFTAGDGTDDGPSVRFGVVTAGRTAVYALSDTAVGLGLGERLGPSARAEADARSAARRGAYDQMAVRGRCGPGRDALPADLTYVAVPGDLVVTALWRTPAEPTPS
ncbi:hypothetical protein [Streptomyces sp. CC208A]|uniref:hypothetical protein n=1 Tax=Streptomyces sp. CC208A TaxID=3044573 RepID=UPI0024A84652|nr:hypothetical protein [Streptomyces sp. CC208A]